LFNLQLRISRTLEDDMKTSTLVSASAAFALLLTAAAPAAAHGPIRQIVTYYSDLDPTQEVGQAIYYCDGHASFTGYQGTSNYVEENFSCP
jgi:hypothetical protein